MCTYFQTLRFSFDYFLFLFFFCLKLSFVYNMFIGEWLYNSLYEEYLLCSIHTLQAVNEIYISLLFAFRFQFPFFFFFFFYDFIIREHHNKSLINYNKREMSFVLSFFVPLTIFENVRRREILNRKEDSPHYVIMSTFFLLFFFNIIIWTISPKKIC